MTEPTRYTDALEAIDAQGAETDAEASVTEQLYAYYEQLKDSPPVQGVRDIADRAVSYIERNPVQSVLAALGAGLLFGLLLPRGRS